MSTSTWASASRARLVLLFVLLGLGVGAGALPSRAAWQSPPPPAPVWPNTACVSRTERGVVFDLLGYQTQPDGTTVLAVRITNPQRLALDALGFTSAGWQRVAPAEGSTYPGRLGTYSVQWVLDLVLPKLPAFRFRPQGAWFQKGASETFVLTVRTFDAKQPLVAWARANLQLAVLQVRPADFPCLIVPPTPTPTLTPTLTSTPTPPFSPLPIPTPAPNLTLDDYQFGAPTVVLTDTQSLEVQEWLPDGQWTLINVSGYDGGLRLFNPATHEVRRLLADGFGGYKAVWLASTQQFAVTSNSNTTSSTLSFVGLAGPPAKLATRGYFVDRIVGRDNRVMVLPSHVETPLLFDGNGNSVALPPLNLHDYKINDPGDGFGTILRWHPTEPKVIISDQGGFIVFNIETSAVKPYDMRFPKGYLPHPWAFDAQWSPDGQTIAINHVDGDLPFRYGTRLVLMNVATGNLQLIQLPRLFYVDDMAWAPNGRQLLVAGKDNTNLPARKFILYLVDLASGEFRRLDSFTDLIMTGWVDDAVAWSSDGKHLLFSCFPPKDTNAVIALCTSTVRIGGGQ